MKWLDTETGCFHSVLIVNDELMIHPSSIVKYWWYWLWLSSTYWVLSTEDPALSLSLHMCSHSSQLTDSLLTDQRRTRKSSRIFQAIRRKLIAGFGADWPHWSDWHRDDTQLMDWVRLHQHWLGVVVSTLISDQHYHAGKRTGLSIWWSKEICVLVVHRLKREI